MTREEIEAKVRSVRRLCKGPPLWNEEEQKDFQYHIERVGQHGAAGLPAARRKIYETQLLLKERYPNVNIGLGVPDLDTPDHVSRALVKLMRLHRSDVNEPCGYDFNKIILAGPLDGQEHEYVCPECGVRGIYIAPLFEEAP